MRSTFRVVGLIAVIAVIAFAAPTRPIRSQPLHSRWTAYARITGYDLYGYTYGGTITTAGETAACSWDIPLFSTVTVAGDTYICEDRGDLGDGYPYSWVDIYAPNPWVIPATYGDWQYIDIE